MHTQEKEKKGTILRKLLNYVDLTTQHLEQGHVLENIHSFCTWGKNITTDEMTWGKKRSHSTSWLLVQLRLRLWSCNSEPIFLFLMHLTHSFFFFLWAQFSDYSFLLLLRSLLRKVMGISSNQGQLYLSIIPLCIYSTSM